MSVEEASVLRLAAYGHSYVEGAGASDASRCFVAIVADRLGGTVDNNGVGGSLSTDTASIVTAGPPPAADYYLLMTGLNDSRLHGEDLAGETAFASAVATIFDAFARASPRSRVIAVEQPHLHDYSQHIPHNRGSDALVDAYNERLRAVAARYTSVVLCRVEFWNALTMLAADTVHPNDLGHREIARAAYDAAVVRSRP